VNFGDCAVIKEILAAIFFGSLLIISCCVVFACAFIAFEPKEEFKIKEEWHGL